MDTSYRFEFVDDIATADAAFRAYGDDLAGMFASAAAALFATIVELDSIQQQAGVKVEIVADDREQLLFKWLAELVYLKDTRREVYSEFEVEVTLLEDGYRLSATIKGESFDPERHQARVDVKAVTYHQLEVKETDSGYEGFVILDL